MNKHELCDELIDKLTRFHLKLDTRYTDSLRDIENSKILSKKNIDVATIKDYKNDMVKIGKSEMAEDILDDFLNMFHENLEEIYD